MKHSNRQNSIFFILLSVILASCAQYRLPEGGPVDVTPPILDTLQSSKLFKTNFKKGDITLNFNEWLKAGNAQQVLVSPPLEFSPRINTRGKTVIFEFNDKEVLKENTTYVINFGEYISDLNEGNIVPNMVYVFSTGDVIDSLSISTQFKQEGEEKIPESAILMIYDTPRDSNILDKKPLYAGFSNKAGQVKVSYMAPGTYYVYALVDKNANYLFDGGEELVGFVREPVEVTEEITLPTMILFKEEPLIAKPVLAKKNNGRQELTYNQHPGQLYFGSIPEGVRFSYKKEKDKVTLYHYSQQVVDWKLAISNSLGKRDTLRIKSDSTSAGFAPGKAIPMKFETNMVNQDFKTEKVVFPFPVWGIDPALMKLEIMKDSVFSEVSSPVEYRLGAEGWEMTLDHKWINDTIYRLSIYPDALESLWTTKNTDTLQVELKRGAAADYGIIDIVLTDLDSTEHYLYELLLADKVISKGVVVDRRNERLSFKRLLPGAYSLKLVVDLNKNGRADLGKVIYKRRAEPVIKRDLDELRADWDLELEINVSEAINKKI